MSAIAVVVPGQGTQTPGMGEPWRSTPAWEVMERAETALGLPLAHLLVSPVRWRSTMGTLVEMGSNTFVEVGPGNVLAGLATRSVGTAVTLRSVTAPTDALLEVA